MRTLRQKMMIAFLTASISAPSAFVAYNLTLPSEGLVLSPYFDPVGYKTYCVGHLAKEKTKASYSEEECMEIFAKDWKKHEKELEAAVKVPFKSEWQKAALVDFTFNNGIGNVKSSTLLRLLNRGQHKQSCEQLIRWVYAKGKKLNGLVKRRDKTMPYCLGELSWDTQKAYEQFKKDYLKILEEK